MIQIWVSCVIQCQSLLRCAAGPAARSTVRSWFGFTAMEKTPSGASPSSRRSQRASGSIGGEPNTLSTLTYRWVHVCEDVLACLRMKTNLLDAVHKFSPRQRRHFCHQTFNAIMRTRPLLSVGDSRKRSRHRSPRSPAHAGHRQWRRSALHQQQNLGVSAA